MSISNLSWRTVAIAAMVAGMGLSARQAATARDLIVEVDGRQVYLGNRQSAYLDRGVWMIPAVPVLRAGDVWCRWDSRRGELEVSTLAGRLRLFADSYTVENGVHRETLSRPVAVHHGAPFVPAEFLERCLRRPMHYDRGRDAMCFGDRPDWRRYDG
ncbi:MAG: hypothetical protein FJX72_18515, partial [Armatimonadetes bacterium]|nr:hypothetical protein [Armatimonadota bacterium]